MRKILPSIVLGLALAPLATAQCSKLAVSGGAAGKEMSIAVSGSTKKAMTFLMIGEKTGKTAIKLGSLGTLNVGLAQPFMPVLLGRTDGNGDLKRSFKVPAKAKKKDFHVQAISVSLKMKPLSLSFCASNVAKASVGS